MTDLPKVYEVNERIIKEIKKRVEDKDKRDFLLEILSFELEHFDEDGTFRYKDMYKKILDKYSTKEK